MNSRFSQSRRTFIKCTLTSAGGMALGFLLSCKKTEHETANNTTEFTPNAWLTIHRDNSITIMLTESEMGQGVMTSMPMLIAEELDANWDTIQVIQAPVDPVFGWQGTGGSRSVRDGWEPLRIAGATARAMLITAAARVWQVPESDCTTTNNSVQHITGKRVLGYGELAPIAATLNVPSNVTLKNPADYKLIGKSVARLDIPDKTTGKAIFGIDIRLPGMLHASIRHCPVFGGKLLGYNKKQVSNISGIRHIIPLDNALAVVADDYWTAYKAIGALQIEWDYGAAKDNDTSQIASQFFTLSDKSGKILRNDGDFDHQLKTSTYQIRREYQTAFQAHATMEPMCCTAHVHDGKCEVWAPTQQPSAAVKAAASAANLPEANVSVNTTLLGGGFGRRNIQDFVSQSVTISQLTGSPVKLIWSREEDIQHDYYNPATHQILTAALDKSGMPIGWYHKLIGTRYAGGAKDFPYSIPNVKVETIDVKTGIPTGPWRSVAYSYTVFATESFIDELAVLTGHDPIEYRLKLLTNSPRLANVLTMAADKSDWAKQASRDVFMGVAVTESFGSYVAEIAQVHLDKKGKPKLDKLTCVVDCGIAINPDTIKAQIEGAIVYGLTAALKSKITITNGKVAQSNFHDFPLLTFSEMPVIETYIVDSQAPPGGIGEPGVPPAAPAVANALAYATGNRFRELPLITG